MWQGRSKDRAERHWPVGPLFKIKRTKDPCPRPFDYSSRNDGLEAWIHDARNWIVGDSTKQDLVRQAIAGVSSGTANNAQETINAALLDRGGKPGPVICTRCYAAEVKGTPLWSQRRNGLW